MRNLSGSRRGMSGMVKGRFWRFGKMARLVSRGWNLSVGMEDEQVLHIERLMAIGEMKIGA